MKVRCLIIFTNIFNFKLIHQCVNVGYYTFKFNHKYKPVVKNKPLIGPEWSRRPITHKENKLKKQKGKKQIRSVETKKKNKIANK
jgi:hypothetical protein